MNSNNGETTNSSPGAAPPVAYYKIDNRKITLLEYWNIFPSWKVVLPWLAGRLNLNTGTGGSLRKPNSVAELAVSESEIPPLAHASLQPLIDECSKLGFSAPRYHKLDNLRGDVIVSFVSMLHSREDCALRLMHSLATGVNPPKETRFLVILSQLCDGTYFLSTNSKPQLQGPKDIVVNRLIDAPPAQVVESHQKHLAEFAKANNRAERVFSEEKLDELSNRYERYTFEAGVKRGLYVQMTPAEINRERQVVAGARMLTAEAGQEHADVLLQISILQNSKPGWGSAATILLVSLLVFVLAGTRQFSWSYLIILVPVLFFHELGHYVAMRLFRYRNLRMFFIPFFGAAVVGQHYNVPGWKKVVVSLMGPVPGIILGAGIGGLGIVFQNILMMRIALVALILNGSNLLPVLPLDGGWVFHALLFRRNPMLEAVFRVVAAFGLAALGVIIHSEILIFLSIPMLLSVGVIYRLARTATHLRAADLPLVSEDDQNIPPETARVIITELKKGTPGTYAARSLAQQTLQIFESINARPPSWPATCGLLLVHLGSLSLAAIVCVGVMAAKHNALFGDLIAHWPQPHRPLACTGPPFSSLQAGLATVKDLTIVAHFKSPADTSAACKKLRPTLPASTSLDQFGCSLFIKTTNFDQSTESALLRDVRRLAKGSFAATSNSPAVLCISALLPSEARAQELSDELAEYFNTEPRRLVPPWFPQDSRTLAQKSAHRLARQTYLKAEAITADVWDDPELNQLQIEMQQANKSGDTNKAEALALKLNAAVVDLSRARLRTLASSNNVDPKVINLFLAGTAASKTGDEPAQEWKELAVDEMGVLLGSGVGNTADNRFSCQTGMATHDGARLELTMVVLNEVSDGAPTIAAWLCDHGASDLKYDIISKNLWSLTGKTPAE
jgi:Zn-dependent protease